MVVENNMGVGLVAEGEIRKGKTDEEVLEVVKRHFPDSNTTLKSIRYYRSNLRRRGYNVPTMTEIKRHESLHMAA